MVLPSFNASHWVLSVLTQALPECIVTVHKNVPYLVELPTTPTICVAQRLLTCHEIPCEVHVLGRGLWGRLWSCVHQVCFPLQVDLRSTCADQRQNEALLTTPEHFTNKLVVEILRTFRVQLLDCEKVSPLLTVTLDRGLPQLLRFESSRGRRPWISLSCS